MKLNIENAKKLREILGHQYDYFSKLKTNVYSDPWNQVTTLLDRIEVTIKHINLIDLRMSDGTSIAFGYYDLISNVYNLSSYINTIAKYFNSPEFKKTLSNTNIFNEIGFDGKGTDDLYVRYLRSLTASDHSKNTSYYIKTYQLESETCPFVYWSLRNNKEGYTDLELPIYSSSRKTIYLQSSKIYLYAQRKIDSLKLLFSAIEDTISDYYNKFKDVKIKLSSEFSSFSEYILYLSNELDLRIGNDHQEIFQYYSILFECDLNLLQNKANAKLYLEEVKTAILKISRYIQSLDDNDYTSDYKKLYAPYIRVKDLQNYGYQLSKIVNLNTKHSSINDRLCVKELSAVLNPYMTYDDAQNDFEMFTTVSVALFMYARDNGINIYN